MTLFILHGWSIDPTTLQKWQHFCDLLEKKGIKTTILKLPGLSAPLNEVWGLPNYVEWLDDQLKDQKDVVLLGHSFGGQIAIRYTAQFPHKVQKLILLDSAGMRDHRLMPTVKRRVFYFAAKLGKIFFRSEVFRQLLYRLAQERDYQNAPPLLRRTMSTILDDEVIKDLPHVHALTLIIWGNDDQVTPLFMGQFYHQKIEGSQLQIIAQARHSPQYTHPEQLANLIEEFLQP